MGDERQQPSTVLPLQVGHLDLASLDDALGRLRALLRFDFGSSSASTARGHPERTQDDMDDDEVIYVLDALRQDRGDALDDEHGNERRVCCEGASGISSSSSSNKERRASARRLDAFEQQWTLDWLRSTLARLDRLSLSLSAASDEDERLASVYDQAADTLARLLKLDEQRASTLALALSLPYPRGTQC